MTNRMHRSRTPALVRAGGVAAALALLLAGCASGSDTSSLPETPSPAAPATPSTTASPSVTPPTPKDSAPAPSGASADVTVAIDITEGKVTTGVQNVKVKRGQSVLIRGVSDVADSLHVHGYDKSLDLQPGKPAELTLTADVTGVFEIETHETAQLVAKLTVS